MTFVKKNLASIIAFAIIALLSIPLFTFAQGVSFSESNSGIGGVMAKIFNLLRYFITILIVAATAFFIYGVVFYVIKDDKEEGKKKMINGLIGLFVIVAFWGIIRIVQNTFNLDNNNQIQGGASGDIGCIVGVTC